MAIRKKCLCVLRSLSTLWIYATVVCLVIDLCLAGDPETDPDRDPSGGRHDDDIDVQISRERKSSRDVPRKIIVTCILEEPYMMLKQHSMGSFIAGNDRFEGYMADMIKNLSHAIGFDYVIQLSRDGKYGESDLKGNWNGMIGEIHRGEADIAVGPITVTSERLEVVDFTDPFMAFRSTALLKKPKKRRKPQRIESAEDLLQSDVIYGVLDNSITQRVMRTTEDPLYISMWARMMNFWPTPFVQTIQEGIQRATTENYGFIVDTPLAEYQIGKEPCDLYTIEPFLDTRRYALALRKNDRLVDVINNQLGVMHEKLILSEFYLKWWRSACDIYVPLPDAPATKHTVSTAAYGNKVGEVGKLGSRASCLHGSISLMTLTIFIVFFTKSRFLNNCTTTLIRNWDT